VLPGGLSSFVASLQVYVVDEVPILVLHLSEAHISQDTCIVDEDVDPAVRLDGRGDDLVSIDNAVVVGDCLSSSLLDLLDDEVGSLSRCSLQMVMKQESTKSREVSR
jgi:hypothetical protein